MKSHLRNHHCAVSTVRNPLGAKYGLRGFPTQNHLLCLVEMVEKIDNHLDRLGGSLSYKGGKIHDCLFIAVV